MIENFLEITFTKRINYIIDMTDEERKQFLKEYTYNIKKKYINHELSKISYINKLVEKWGLENTLSFYIQYLCEYYTDTVLFKKLLNQEYTSKFLKLFFDERPECLVIYIRKIVGKKNLPLLEKCFNEYEELQIYKDFLNIMTSYAGIRKYYLYQDLIVAYLESKKNNIPVLNLIIYNYKTCFINVLMKYPEFYYKGLFISFFKNLPEDIIYTIDLSRFKRNPKLLLSLLHIFENKFNKKQKNDCITFIKKSMFYKNVVLNDINVEILSDQIKKELLNEITYLQLKNII